MTEKEKLEEAIEFVEAIVGGLQFAFATKKTIIREVMKRQLDLIEALQYLLRLAEEKRYGEKSDLSNIGR